MQCPWASASQLLSGHSMQCIPGAPCLADNLLPLSCKGQDWQGGISITLLDALDTFLGFLWTNNGIVQRIWGMAFFYVTPLVCYLSTIFEALQGLALRRRQEVEWAHT
eukprot:1142707-Pelagomonas_calceolata.AAC.2